MTDDTHQQTGYNVAGHGGQPEPLKGHRRDRRDAQDERQILEKGLGVHRRSRGRSRGAGGLRRRGEWI